MPCVLEMNRYGWMGYMYFDDHSKPHIHIRRKGEDLFVVSTEQPFDFIHPPEKIKESTL